MEGYIDEYGQARVNIAIIGTYGNADVLLLRDRL
jgi:hypothetical protein